MKLTQLNNLFILIAPYGGGFLIAIGRCIYVLVLCTREDCKHNSDQSCIADQVGIVDRQCVTYKRARRKEDYEQLMRQPFNPNCEKTARGYRSSRVKGMLK